MRPFAFGDIQIPYGRDAGGRMLHISEVPSGLISGCVCPACGTPLVAYKGEKRRAHFGHRADRACSGALETALHAFAKQALDASKTLMLPPLVARHGEAEEPLSPAQMFGYDTVTLEKTMPNMRPDVVVRRGEAELLVEVAVTHPCEEIKLTRIRERRLPAIEIDLSRVRRDATPQEHADAVLRSAPRRWLFNRYIDQREEELRQQALQQARAERERHKKAWGKLAADLTAAYAADAGEAHPGWLSAIQDANLEQYIGVSIVGDPCFAVAATVWQSALLHNFVLRCNGDIDPAEATEWLAEKGFLKPPFRDVPVHAAAAMKEYLTAAVPGFRPAVEVVSEFMSGLARQDVIYKDRTRWSSSTLKASEARRQWDQTKAARKRWIELQEEVQAIKEAAQRGTDIDFETWATARHDGMNGTPEDIVWAGGFVFDDLKRRIQSLRESLKPGAYSVSGSLLGLPLEQDQEARRLEQQERRESEQRERERREQVAAKKRRQETQVFLAELRLAVQDLLGVEAGDSWLSTHVPPALDGSEELDLRPAQMDSIRRALEMERHRLEDAVQAKAAASALALRCLDELRAQAARDPALSSSGRLDLWMGTSQPRLGGARPKDFCVDQQSLWQCLGLLPSRLPRNWRR